jgi:pyruvate/2-oxoacid:ferredoxin oxidoreductase beta subunit
MELIHSPNEAMPRSWRRETKPHRFCPGCGHGIFLKALGEAIDELQIWDRVVVRLRHRLFATGLGFL